MLTLHGNALSGGVPSELQRLPMLVGGYSLLDGIAVPATLDLADNQLRYCTRYCLLELLVVALEMQLVLNWHTCGGAVQQRHPAAYAHFCLHCVC